MDLFDERSPPPVSKDIGCDADEMNGSIAESGTPCSRSALLERIVRPAPESSRNSMVYERLATGGEPEATTAGHGRKDPMKHGTADTRSARRGWADKLKTGAIVSMSRSIMLPVEYGGTGDVGTRVASLASLPLATPTAAATVAGTRRRRLDLGLERGVLELFLSVFVVLLVFALAFSTFVFPGNAFLRARSRGARS